MQVISFTSLICSECERLNDFWQISAAPGRACCCRAWWSPPCSPPSPSHRPASLPPRSSAFSPASYINAMLHSRLRLHSPTCWQSFGTLSAHFWWNLNPQVRQQKPDKKQLKSWPFSLLLIWKVWRLTLEEESATAFAEGEGEESFPHLKLQLHPLFYHILVFFCQGFQNSNPTHQNEPTNIHI